MIGRLAKTLLLSTFSLSVYASLAPGNHQVVAQQTFELESVFLSVGSTVPVSLTNVSQPLYFAPSQVYSLSLTVPQNIMDSTGSAVIIPAGSLVNGTLQPAQGGSTFLTQSITIGNRIYPLQASSGLINDEKDPREYAGRATAGDAGIGAAGGALIGSLFTGGAGVGALIGTGLGIGVGNVTAPQVVVLRPNQTLNITLQAPFQL